MKTQLKREKKKRRAAREEKPSAPVVQLVPSLPRPEPSLKISYEAVGQVRARAQNSPPQLFTTTERFNPEVFRPARPPRGVVPDNVQPMAMDEDLGGMWSGSGIGYSENLQWLGMPFLAELSQRAEYRQIVETLAKEMTRKWIRVIANGDGDFTDKIAVIETKLKKHKIREKFRRLAELDGFFGRGHLYVDTGITGERDLLKTALILDKRLNDKGFLRGFRVVEPSWSYPGSYNSADPLAEDFYRPHTWYVFGKEVHRSRFITFVSRELPDLLKPSYAFGGMSMSQLAKPYVDNWLRTRQSVSDLVHSFSVSGIKTDMSTIMMGGGAEQLMLRAELFSQARDNLGTMVIDKDREEFFNVSTPLGTLDHLQAQAQEQLASVSHEPLIVLLGITPSGLNASSDGELQVWASYVKSMQEHLFDDPLRFVIEAIQLNEFGEIDPAIDFNYEPLRELSEAEEATARKTDADTDKVYVDGGVLSPDEIRSKIAADPDSPYAGIDLSAPAPEPPPDTDPLAGPPDGGGDGPSDGSDAPRDALGRLAASIAARREDMAYQNWWDGAADAEARPFARDAEFKESDHPRGQPGNAGQFGSGIALAIGVDPHSRGFGSGGDHSGGVITHGESHDHATVHKTMVKAGFKRVTAKHGIASTKLGKSAAHTSSKTQHSTYEHPDGHTATVKTDTPKYSDAGPFSHITVHLKPPQAHDEFKESDHPRGQPGNAGEFGSSGGPEKKPKHFHGTSAATLASIMEHGLKPRGGAGADMWLTTHKGAHYSAERNDANGRPQSVFVTKMPSEARSYATRVAELSGADPIVLVIEIPPDVAKGNMRADEEARGMRQTAYRFNGIVKPEWIVGTISPEQRKSTKVTPIAHDDDGGQTLYLVIHEDDESEPAHVDEE